MRKTIDNTICLVSHFRAFLFGHNGCIQSAAYLRGEIYIIAQKLFFFFFSYNGSQFFFFFFHTSRAATEFVINVLPVVTRVLYCLRFKICIYFNFECQAFVAISELQK